MNDCIRGFTYTTMITYYETSNNTHTIVLYCIVLIAAAALNTELNFTMKIDEQYYLNI